MTTITMHCPICDESSFVQGAPVFDDRYGEPNLYHLARCAGCGHLSTSPRLGEQDLPGLYGTYYPRKAAVAAEVAAEADLARKPFASLKRWWAGTNNQGQYSTKVGDKVLDVGCGAGVSLLEAQILGGQAYGIETDRNIKPLADALGMTMHFGNLHDRPFADVRFDLIIMNQVIEHVPDPDRALVALRDRLHGSGRLVLVFPNQSALSRRLTGARWINWHIPFHLHHYDAAHIRLLAQRCGYDVVRLRTVTPNVWTLLQVRAMFHRPQRGQPSPVWHVAQRSESAGGLPPAVTLPGFVKKVLRACVMTLIAMVNRVVDAFGLGDSLYVELRPRKT